MPEAKPQIEPGERRFRRSEEAHRVPITCTRRSRTSSPGAVGARVAAPGAASHSTRQWTSSSGPGSATRRRGRSSLGAARITAHLRALSGAANLAAWNDAAERRLEDVHQLLELAGLAYPTD